MLGLVTGARLGASDGLVVLGCCHCYNDGTRLDHE